MRVLFVTPEYLFPQKSGNLIYSKQMLSWISQSAAHVDVVCFRNTAVPESVNPSDETEMERVSFHITDEAERPAYLRLLGRLPMSANRFSKKAARAKLKSLLQGEYDWVVFSHLSTSWAWSDIQKAFKAKGLVPRVLFSTQNHEYETRRSIYKNASGLKKLANLFDLLRIYAAEKNLVTNSERVISITNRDSQALFKHYGREGICAIPPVYEEAVVGSRIIDANVPKKIVVLGSFYWTAKQQNLEQFLEAAHRRLSDEGISIRVVGSGPQSFFQQMTEKFPGVEMTGFVDDVGGYLSDVRLAILPELSGGGFKLTSLRLIFSRLPIFTFRGVLEELKGDIEAYTSLDDDFPGLVSSIIQHIDDFESLNGMQELAFSENRVFIDETDRLKTISNMLLTTPDQDQ